MDLVSKKSIYFLDNIITKRSLCSVNTLNAVAKPNRPAGQRTGQNACAHIGVKSFVSSHKLSFNHFTRFQSEIKKEQY